VARGRLRLSDQGEEQRSEQFTKALLSVMDSAASSGDVTSNATSTIAPFADKINLILQVLSNIEGQVEDPAAIDENTTEAELQMSYRELRCWYAPDNHFLKLSPKRGRSSRTDDFISRIILYLRIIAIHKSEIVSNKWTSTDQGRLIIGLCALLEVCYGLIINL